MNPNDLVFIALIIPLLTSVAILVLWRAPNLRELATLIGGAATFFVAIQLAGAVAAGQTPQASLGTIAPGMALTLRVEPLGAVFALVASGLWIVNSLFSIGYMRGNKERDQTRFYFFFALAITSALGIAMSGDLLTMFVFYEALTLSTFPLVSHKGDEKARRGARIYLAVLLTTSLGLLLPAIIATYALTGSLSFEAGGMAFGDAPDWLIGLVLFLFAFGIGKAALMPVHFWLPNAMVAPTPVSALLHAVAVVKAGVFTMLKVSIYVFGPERMQELPAADWLAGIAAISIVVASLIALRQDNLKARLAYSTVSQLSYVTLGAMIATPAALMGGALQLVMHAVGKITLFMCAGSIYTGAKRTEISDMRGLGKAMPWTFAAFAIGSASIIGLPPLAGAWPKLELLTGAADVGRPLLALALVASTILNVAYLAPIAMRGLFLNPPRGADPVKGSPLLAVLPPVITAALCIILFFYAGAIAEFLAPAINPGGAR